MNRGDRCIEGNKYPEGAVCERLFAKKASAAFTLLTSACDPEADRRVPAKLEMRFQKNPRELR
jgi:hypothetical protein